MEVMANRLRTKPIEHYGCESVLHYRTKLYRTTIRLQYYAWIPSRDNGARLVDRKTSLWHSFPITMVANQLVSHLAAIVSMMRLSTKSVSNRVWYSLPHQTFLFHFTFFSHLKSHNLRRFLPRGQILSMDLKTIGMPEPCLLIDPLKKKTFGRRPKLMENLLPVL